MQPQIIQIRGTSGSGKSTLVKRILDQFYLGDRRQPVQVMGRKRPIMYECMSHDGCIELSVIGHYEIACGGTDTISGMDQIYGMVEAEWFKGRNVLFEGLLASDEKNRTLALAAKAPVTCIFLNTPIELCLSSVNERRRAKDPTKEDVNPKNTQNKHRSTQSTMRKLQAAGVNCLSLSREEAYTYLQEALGFA